MKSRHRLPLPTEARLRAYDSAELRALVVAAVAVLAERQVKGDVSRLNALRACLVLLEEADRTPPGG